MSMNFLSGFWYNLWHPMYEALFGSDTAGEWLNWGFWFALIVVAVIVVVYILVFCLMKPKYTRDENGNIVPVAKDVKAGKGDAGESPEPEKDEEKPSESMKDFDSPGGEENEK